MTYKIYVTDPEGKRLRIFADGDDNAQRAKDHLVRKTLKEALIVMRELNEQISKANDEGKGTLKDCIANMQIIP